MRYLSKNWIIQLLACAALLHGSIAESAKCYNGTLLISFDIDVWSTEYSTYIDSEYINGARVYSCESLDHSKNYIDYIWGNYIDLDFGHFSRLTASRFLLSAADGDA
jgi:hypothetical protein